MGDRTRHAGWTLTGLLLSASSAAGAPGAGVVVLGLAPGDERAAPLAERAHAAVAARPELDARPLAETQATFAATGPTDRGEALAKAEALLEQAEEALRGFDISGAGERLDQASALLDPDAGLAHTLALDQHRLALEVALAHARRDERALAKALTAYAARFADDTPDVGLWPPDLRRRLATVAARAQTSLRILSAPDGEAWVDGRPVGATPATVGDLPPGRHRVEVRAEGRFPARAWVETAPAKLAEARLAPAPDVSTRLAAADPRGALPEPLAAELATLAQKEQLELLVLVGPAGDDRVVMRLLDVPSAEVHAPAVAASPDEALAQAWASRAASRARRPSGLAPWAYGAAGLGVALAAVGTGLRLWAVDTQDPLSTRRGALTQAEAFDIQDRASQRGTAGAALLVSGAALVAGAAGLLTWDLVGSEP